MKRCNLKDIRRIMAVIESHHQEGEGDDLYRDLAFALQNPNAYLLMPESGRSVFIMEPRPQGAWSMHVSSYRHHTGVLDEGREAVRWMFQNVAECGEIFGVPPEGRRDVRYYALRLCRTLGGEWGDNHYRVRRTSCHLS